MSAIFSLGSDIPMYSIKFLQFDSLILELFFQFYPPFSLLKVELFEIDDGLDLAECL